METKGTVLSGPLKAFHFHTGTLQKLRIKNIEINNNNVLCKNPLVNGR